MSALLPVSFRRAIDADARAAADLWLRARKAAIGVIPPPVHDDDDVRAWFASHVVPDTDLWLADDRAGALVGILVLDGRWLDQLYVEPAMTGRGIGGGLVEVAKRERPHGLWLWTFASNAGARRFTSGTASSWRPRPGQRGVRPGHPLRLASRTAPPASIGEDERHGSGIAWPRTGSHR